MTSLAGAESWVYSPFLWCVAVAIFGHCYSSCTRESRGRLFLPVSFSLHDPDARSGSTPLARPCERPRHVAAVPGEGA